MSFCWLFPHLLMHSFRCGLFVFALLRLNLSSVQAQEVVNTKCTLSQERSLVQLTEQATVVVEGRVETSRCFRNPKGRIYTATLITVFKVFKGVLQGDLVEIITPGGTVGDQWEVHDDNPAVLPLSSGGVGLFFGVPTVLGPTNSGVPNTQVLDLVGEYEGYIRYSGEDPEPSTAYSACRRYRNVPTTLYAPIQAAARASYTELHPFEVENFRFDYSYGRTARKVPAPMEQRSVIVAPRKQKKKIKTGTLKGNKSH